jgi:hypothetical protein
VLVHPQLHSHCTCTCIHTHSAHPQTQTHTHTSSPLEHFLFAVFKSVLAGVSILPLLGAHLHHAQTRTTPTLCEPLGVQELKEVSEWVNVRERESMYVCMCERMYIVCLCVSMRESVKGEREKETQREIACVYLCANTFTYIKPHTNYIHHHTCLRAFRMLNFLWMLVRAARLSCVVCVCVCVAHKYTTCTCTHKHSYTPHALSHSYAQILSHKNTRTHVKTPTKILAHTHTHFHRSTHTHTHTHTLTHSPRHLFLPFSAS